MLHESDLEQKINVTDADINFESIYEKDYIPQKYICLLYTSDAADE